MDRISPESQDSEYKTSWHDDWFGWLSAFANADGGCLYVGVNDDGYVVGLRNQKSILETLPNRIISVLGIVPGIDAKSVPARGTNVRYADVPGNVTDKLDNLYAMGLLTDGVLGEIESAPGNSGLP